MALVDKVVDLHRTLAHADIVHAFGGALALAYHAQPRGTREIDLNVFVLLAERHDVLDVLATLDWVDVAAILDERPLAGGGGANER